MIQDILTYSFILLALIVALRRMYKVLRSIVRGEMPGCSGCALHQLHSSALKVKRFEKP